MEIYLLYYISSHFWWDCACNTNFMWNSFLQTQSYRSCLLFWARETIWPQCNRIHTRAGRLNIRGLTQWLKFKEFTCVTKLLIHDFIKGSFHTLNGLHASDAFEIPMKNVKCGDCVRSLLLFGNILLCFANSCNGILPFTDLICFSSHIIVTVFNHCIWCVMMMTQLKSWMYVMDWELSWWWPWYRQV